MSNLTQHPAIARLAKIVELRDDVVRQVAFDVWIDDWFAVVESGYALYVDLPLRAHELDQMRIRYRRAAMRDRHALDAAGEVGCP